MAENFNLIWGSNASQTTVWNDSDYQRGWETVGDTPPTAQQFDALQRRNDLKAQELNNTIAPIAEANDANNRKPQTVYKVGDMQYDNQLPTGWYLLCTVGGTSGDGDITFPTPLVEDASVLDGDVVWRLHKLSTSVANIDSLEKSLAESTGYGIISGCTPSISGLTVTVGAGIVHLADGTRKELSAMNVTLDSADASNPRIDLVYINADGVVAKVTGTAEATPSAPSVPANGVSVAQVSVEANAVTGTVVDSRGMLARWYNAGIVNVKDYGAVGDGVTNNYNVFLAASNTGKTIFVPHGTYYIDGASPIKLNSNFICDDATFIVGDSHFKQEHPVFEYVHDSEVDSVDCLLSDIISDNYTVTSTYSNKFFVIDTQIAYGTAVSDNAPDDETIKETCFTNKTSTKVYFADDVSTYLSSSVKAMYVSDIDEKGYIFSGAKVKQKTNNSYGICFLRVRRHNMTIRDIQIKADNTAGEHSVFLFERCNNLLINNVISYSTQPSASWGYELSIYYSSNIIVDGLRGNNDWSSLATRGLKNYTMINSVSSTFDCHWNAYGNFLCENCLLWKDAHIGYGKGTFTIRDTVCEYVGNRFDYTQVWAGDIVVDNVSVKTGVWIYLESGTTGYSAFFNNIILPTVKITKLKTSTRSLYIRVPDAVAARIGSKAKMFIDTCDFGSLDVPYRNVVYDLMMKNTPTTTGQSSTLKKACKYANVDNDSLRDSITSTKFSSIDCNLVRKINGVTCINFSGVLSSTLNAWDNIGTISDDFKPTHAVYFAATYDNTSIGITIGAGGTIAVTNAVGTANKRLSFSVAYIGTEIY
jgi:hypothetical protein